MNRFRLAAPLACLLMFVLLVTGAPLLAGDADPKSSKTDKPAAAKKSEIAGATGGKASKQDSDEEVLVFTNADLKKVTPKPSATPETPGTPVAGDRPLTVQRPAGANAADPLKWMQEQKAAAAQRQQQVKEAEATVVEAEQKLADLEKRLLALRNPFLARPEKPKDDETWNEADGQERVRRTDKALEDARTELADAQKALAGARSR